MTTSKLIAIALAALLVFAGTAVASSHAPSATQADENATDAAETPPEDPGGDAGDMRDENASDAPPTEMPANASDHVSEIHALIGQFLDGTLEGSLGPQVSDVVANDSDNANDAASQGSENAADEAGSQSQADSAEERSGNADRAGPIGDVPEQAADHVSAIHDAITTFLSGDGDGSLGETVSGIVGNGSADG